MLHSLDDESRVIHVHSCWIEVHPSPTCEQQWCSVPLFHELELLGISGMCGGSTRNCPGDQDPSLVLKVSNQQW